MIESILHRRQIAVTLALTLYWAPTAAHACATCFGDPESPQTQGLNGAIITMLSITYGLFTLAAFGVFMLIRRSRKIVDASEEHSLNEGDPTHG